MLLPHIGDAPGYGMLRKKFERLRLRVAASTWLSRTRLQQARSRRGSYGSIRPCGEHVVRLVDREDRALRRASSAMQSVTIVAISMM